MLVDMDNSIRSLVALDVSKQGTFLDYFFSFYLCFLQCIQYFFFKWQWLFVRAWRDRGEGALDCLFGGGYDSQHLRNIHSIYANKRLISMATYHKVNIGI